MALSGALLARLRQSPRARAFLDGVNAASLTLMALVLVHLGRAALVDGWTLALAALAGALLVRTRLNPTWILLGAGGMGWLVRGA